jgi:hypothetical protein
MSNAKACLLMVLIAVAGCATQARKDQGTASVDAAVTDVQCETRQVTGKLISQRVCTTKAERDDAQGGVESTRDSVMKGVDARPGK